MQTIDKLPVLPPRSADSHKGTYGTVLVMAGSRGMTGAAILTATAALRSGAGLVQVACPKSSQPVIAAGYPCYTTIPLSEDADGVIDEANPTSLLKRIESATVVAVGPGLGRSHSLDALVRSLVFHRSKPTVLDADGLNAVAGSDPSRLRGNVPLVLTPHPGEFARLTGQTPEAVAKLREDLAVDFAQASGCVVVLKGHRSIITDGTRMAINTTGNAGMATGGAGDVLTGIIAALIGQGMPAFEAAQLGTHIHGRAGDLAAAEFGMVSLTAHDIVEWLPKAFCENRASGAA